MRKASVLIVSKPLAPPWRHASLNLARDVARHTPDRRFHVLTRGEGHFPERHIREEELISPHEGWRPPAWHDFRLFLRLIKADSCGIYHFFFTPNPLSSTMAALAMAMKPRQPVVQTVCSAPPENANLARLSFADEIVCTSAATCARFHAAGLTRARVIVPGVALPDLPDASAKRALRRGLGLPEDGVLALYAGDYEFSNAATTLVESLPQALTSANLNVVLCGRLKTPRAFAVRESLAGRIRQLGVETRARLLEPQVDLAPLLHAADVLVLTPDTLFAKMDIPLVLLEAMAAGKALLLSALPTLLEACREREEALFVPPGDASALASALCELCESESLRLRLGQAARSRASEAFSLERLGAAHAALYEEMEAIRP